MACLASSCSFVHTIYSFFIDLHGERGKKEGEKGLALKSPRKRGRQESPCCRKACLTGQNPGHRGWGWELRAHCLGLCPLITRSCVGFQGLRKSLRTHSLFFLTSVHNRRLHTHSVFFSRSAQSRMALHATISLTEPQACFSLRLCLNVLWVPTLWGTLFTTLTLTSEYQMCDLQYSICKQKCIYEVVIVCVNWGCFPWTVLPNLVLKVWMKKCSTHSLLETPNFVLCFFFFFFF